MRLIDADELETLYEKQRSLGNSAEEAFQDALQDAHRVDAEPVVYANIVWKNRHLGGLERVKGIKINQDGCTPNEVVEIRIDTRSEGMVPYCGRCGKLLAESSLNYCPYCGARMVSEVQDK